MRRSTVLSLPLPRVILTLRQQLNLICSMQHGFQFFVLTKKTISNYIFCQYNNPSASLHLVGAYKVVLIM